MPKLFRLEVLNGDWKTLKTEKHTFEYNDILGVLIVRGKDLEHQFSQIHNAFLDHERTALLLLPPDVEFLRAVEVTHE